MAGVQPAYSSAAQEESVRDLLREIDAQARDTGWVEKRNNDRRKFRTSCDVHYISPDGESVCIVSGKTRDLSHGGLGFVSPTHFQRRMPLLVRLKLKEGQSKELTGCVAYSRVVKDRWYLTGVTFSQVQDPRLVPGQTPATVPTTAAPPVPSQEMERPTSPTSATEETIRMLNAAKSARSLSKEKIGKIIMAARTPNHEVRRAAIPALVQIGGADVVRPLIQLLEDKNATVQAEAADALGQLQDPEGVEPLKRMLKHDADEVAVAAAEALARFKDDSGRRVAVRILRGDTKLTRRAARALGMIVGQNFRPNADGVAAARAYAKKNRL
jgi:hypothetical protein